MYNSYADSNILAQLNEAKMINGFASRRQVEELYRSFKSENSTFKDYMYIQRNSVHKVSFC